MDGHDDWNGCYVYMEEIINYIHINNMGNISSKFIQTAKTKYFHFVGRCVCAFMLNSQSGSGSRIALLMHIWDCPVSIQLIEWEDHFESCGKLHICVSYKVCECAMWCILRTRYQWITWNPHTTHSHTDRGKCRYRWNSLTAIVYKQSKRFIFYQFCQCFSILLINRFYFCLFYIIAVICVYG